jgi:serine/threonine protein kinase
VRQGGPVSSTEHPQDPTIPDLPADTLASYNPDRTRWELLQSGRPGWGDKTVPLHAGEDTVRQPASRQDDSLDGPASAEAPEPVAGGTFQLQKMIAQGGMGEVWEGIQVSLGRVIAVKRLRRDLVDPAINEDPATTFYAEAFRQEALTAAGLEHPNIVPVHDLGADEDGTPLLAMKLVRGQPWDRMIVEDWVRYPPEEFLARHLPILMQVAQAVSYAHSRGVVHRDLKPSQVMVGSYGEVLLMDWGLALTFDRDRLANFAESTVVRRLTTRATATNPAGTPAFMAPEQTQQTSEGLGPWTDVWLLGGTLYHLLTCTPPYAAPDVRVTFLQAKAGIVDPPAERSPNRFIPADLAALAMRALHPDINERLPSAQDLVAGIEEYLTGAGRRRQSSEATDAIAEGMQARAEDAADYEWFGAQLARLQNAEVLWPGNPEVPLLRGRLGEAYADAAIRSGDLTLARAQAAALPPGDARAGLLARVDSGERMIRRRERQRRLALATAGALLVAIAAGTMVSNRALTREREAARSERDAANIARLNEKRARRGAEELISYMVDDLQDDLMPIGRTKLLEDLANRALAYYESLPDDDQDSLVDANRMEALNTLSMVNRQAGDMRKAHEYISEAEAISREVVRRNPSDLRARNRLGQNLIQKATSHFNLGEPDLAVAAARESVAIYREALGTRPGDRDLLIGLGTALTAVTTLMEDLGRVEEAITSGHAAIEVLGEANAADPSDYEASRFLARALDALAIQYQVLHRHDEARALIERGLALREASALARPDDQRVTMALLTSHDLLGKDASRVDDRPRARRHYTEAVELSRTLMRLDPNNVDWRVFLSASLSQLAGIDLREGGTDIALERFEQALGIMEQVCAANPDNRAWREDLATDLGNTAGVYIELGRLDEARAKLDRAAVLIDELLALTPDSVRLQGRKWMNEYRLGNVAVAAGDRAEGERRYATALAVLTDLHDRFPEVVDHSQNALFLVNQLGHMALDRGDAADALARAAEYHGLLDDVIGRHPGLTEAPAWRRDAVLIEGLAHAEAGDHQAAREELGRYVDELAADAAASPESGDVLFALAGGRLHLAMNEFLAGDRDRLAGRVAEVRAQVAAFESEDEASVALMRGVAARAAMLEALAAGGDGQALRAALALLGDAPAAGLDPRDRVLLVAAHAALGEWDRAREILALPGQRGITTRLMRETLARHPELGVGG